MCCSGLTGNHRGVSACRHGAVMVTSERSAAQNGRGCRPYPCGPVNFEQDKGTKKDLERRLFLLNFFFDHIKVVHDILGEDSGITLGLAEVGMTEHLLHVLDAGAFGEHEDGEGGASHV